MGSTANRRASEAGEGISGSAVPGRRGDFLTATYNADQDIRNTCNALKRLSSIVSASVATGCDFGELLNEVESISEEILQSFGFDADQLETGPSLMGMVADPVSRVVAEAAKAAVSVGEMAAIRQNTVRAIAGLAKSKFVGRMVGQQFPQDISIVAALRVSAATSVATVASETALFDFYIGANRCIREAAIRINEAAFAAADYLAPSDASQASRVVLTQSLLQSAGTIYGSCFKQESVNMDRWLTSLEVDERRRQIDQLSRSSPDQVLAKVNDGFQLRFDAVVNMAVEMVPPTPSMSKGVKP